MFGSKNLSFGWVSFQELALAKSASSELAATPLVAQQAKSPQQE